ncbi:PBP superfamily domain-containing protein [Malonomonas rubra DSM 5091]|uniref:PBP superfamily domain-containing protein n=1 Tax=Malonomonas rubra DSM 5091 TaxID=1122189 RepID=A0A1M6JG16_MALRU|nr:substrate-binding domain-containing protein [Malonomonas rubra]SHJ45643.1 PBP superfamily domain-containing protein [Malonomonas rubra DSM 5091]
MARKILTGALLILLFSPFGGWAQQAEMIAGAAASTEITQLFFEHFRHNFACAEYDFKVMATPIRHKSGVLTTNKFIFGRIANPLEQDEKSMGKEEILLGNVPVIAVVGLETEANGITLKQLEQIYTRKITNWKEVGGNDAPIMLIGKSSDDALLKTLRREYPFFQTARFDKIIKYDDETSKFLQSPAGAHAIAFGAMPNFQLYNHLPVDGFNAAISVGLAYDKKNAHLPVVKAAKMFAASPEWRELLKTIDALPIN